MSLRIRVFEVLAADQVLQGYGINASTLYPNFAPDSPAAEQNRWVTLRWGPTEPALGREASARPVALTVAVYDREKDFSVIEAVLRRIRSVLEALEVTYTANGFITAVDWSFSSDDVFDETYDAVLRSETYRIVASGT